MNTGFAPHRILLALRYLHKERLEQLRICCGRSPSGMHWRYRILPRRFFMTENGLLVHKEIEIPEHPYESLNGNEVDLPGPQQLAEIWLNKFPALRMAQLPDSNYIEWYQNMLDGLGDWDIPVMYADWEIDFDNGFVVGKKILPLPVF